MKKDKIELTEAGKQMVRYSNPPSGAALARRWTSCSSTSSGRCHAHYRFVLDQHYMVIENKIVIIDECTGRPMPDRHWREGLHQAVEAKEKVPITLARDHAAQITFQSLLPALQEARRHDRHGGPELAGDSPRLQALGGVQCRRTSRSCARALPDRVFPTEDAKFDAIVDEVQRMRAAGRPVLIGTRSVEKSEKLSAKLTAAGIPHQVLNAKQNEEEAEIVAQAGQPGKVTIATNMAGRGTDIKLGPRRGRGRRAARHRHGAARARCASTGS